MLPPALVESFFRGAITAIKDEVATQLSTPDLQDLCYIYMVGGFCASPLLQDAIREEFDDPGRDLKVVVAPRPGLAVVSCSLLCLCLLLLFLVYFVAVEGNTFFVPQRCAWQASWLESFDCIGMCLSRSMVRTIFTPIDEWSLRLRSRSSWSAEQEEGSERRLTFVVWQHSLHSQFLSASNQESTSNPTCGLFSYRRDVCCGDGV